MLPASGVRMTRANAMRVGRLVAVCRRFGRGAVQRSCAPPIGGRRRSGAIFLPHGLRAAARFVPVFFLLPKALSNNRFFRPGCCADISSAITKCGSKKWLFDMACRMRLSRRRQVSAMKPPDRGPSPGRPISRPMLRFAFRVLSIMLRKTESGSNAGRAPSAASWRRQPLSRLCGTI